MISTQNGRVTIDLSAIAVERALGPVEAGHRHLRQTPDRDARLALRALRLGVAGARAERGPTPQHVALGPAGARARIRRGRDLPRRATGAAALLRWGLGIVVATLVLGFALALGRGLYLGALPADASQSANAAAYDIVVRLLRTTNRVLFVVGLLIALGAYLAGSSRVALAVRGRTTGALDGVGDRVAAGGFDFHGVAKFVARYANPLRIAGVIVSFLILVIMNHPGVAAVLWLLIALLVYLAVVTILERVGRDRTVATNAAQ